METNLLDRMLDTYQRQRTVLNITLQNRVRLTGTIRAFDSYVIVLGDDGRDIVFRHAVSSVTPRVGTALKPAAHPGQHAIRSEGAEPSPLQRTGAPGGRTADRGRRPALQPQPKTPAAGEGGLNTAMKDALLKWMQDRKASGK